MARLWGDRWPLLANRVLGVAAGAGLVVAHLEGELLQGAAIGALFVIIGWFTVSAGQLICQARDVFRLDLPDWHPDRTAAQLGRPGRNATWLRSLAVCRFSAWLVVGLAAVAVISPRWHTHAVDPWISITWLLLGASAGLYTTNPVARRIVTAAAGAKAEKVVAHHIANVPGVQVVANSYMVGVGGDVDHVVIGPWLAAVETKTGSGVLRHDRRGTRLRTGHRQYDAALDRVARQAVRIGQLAGVTCSPILVVANTTSGPMQVRGVTVCSALDLAGVLVELPTALDDEAAARFADQLRVLHRKELARFARRRHEARFGGPATPVRVLRYIGRRGAQMLGESPAVLVLVTSLVTRSWRGQRGRHVEQ
jgi:hypothetical protein